MSWFSRLKNVLLPDALEQEIVDEMEDHLERRAADLVRCGLREEEAARQAARRFGSAMLRREESREIRSWVTLDSILQDVRYGWRMMIKNWGYAAIAIFSLALAIGANTAIFSIVDAAMLRPLPVAHPEQLIEITHPRVTDPGEDAVGEIDSFSYPLYLALRSAAGNLAHFGLVSYPCRREARIPDAASPLEHLMMQFVSGDAFEILGVRPVLGRLFSAEDDRTPGAHPVAVLSYEYWQSRFGADPAILRSTIQIADKSYFIVGVAQKGFFGVEPGAFIDVWLSAMMYPQKEAFTHPGWHWFRVMGRLAPGANRDALRARLQVPFQQHEHEMVSRFPTIPSAIRKQMLELPIHVVAASGGPSSFRETFSRPLWIVFGVAGVILLISCANIAGLLLARSMARAAEMSMRISLGASRTRLMRQLVTESLLLSGLAGGFGWAAARFIAPVVVHLLSRETEPVRFALAVNTRMLLFCIAVSALATMFFSLLPAWQASGIQPMVAVRFMNRGSGKLRSGSIFVAVQVAFSFCLVLMASAFLLTLHHLVTVNTGFDRQNVSVLSIAAQWEHEPQHVQRGLIDQFQRGIAALPEVESVAVSPYAIFAGIGWTDHVILPGQRPSDHEEIFYRISPGYFKALRTPLLEGRDFDFRDDSKTEPIPAIVNLAFAHRYFGGDHALGKEFQTPAEKKNLSFRVVGIAGNANYGDLRKGPQPITYVPLEGDTTFAMYVRSHLSLGVLVRAIEQEGRAIAPLRVQEVTTLDTLVGNTILREKLLASISGAFAFLGVLLAAIGMFGLLSYSVTRRTKEIGIRTALGAQGRDIVALITKELTPLVGGGLLAGLGTSLAMMRVFQSLLFGTRLNDPLVIGTSAVIFVAAAFAAAGLPTRRAVTVHPMVALRHE